MAIDFLLKKQNPDGGWPYLHGGSWTEPTVYAVLALTALGERAQSKRGLDWMLRTQNADGGWASRPGAGESSWVTAVAALVPAERIGLTVHSKAIDWLMSIKGEDTTALYSLRQWLLGRSRSADEANPGWPWTPGAAAWVGPTSMALVALNMECKRHPSPGLAKRAEAGRSFLVAHMCSEGGWNHGAAKAWDYPAPPYPETTGMALLALSGTNSPRLEAALSMARKFLAESHSADAQNWLRLGLGAQGQLPADYVPPDGIAYRTVSEVALEQIASAGGFA